MTKINEENAWFFWKHKKENMKSEAVEGKKIKLFIWNMPYSVHYKQGGDKLTLADIKILLACVVFSNFSFEMCNDWVKI